MIEADTPNLWEIRLHTDHATAIGIIVIALIHTARLVNVENNLNEKQIGEIANDIIEDYGYLKVEELKYVLKTAIRAKKIFGRLDYNVVMNWIKEYSAERTEEAISISEQKSDEERHNPSHTLGTISFREYLDGLEDAAANGDPEAINKLEQIKSAACPRPVSRSREERDQNNQDFKEWRSQYILNKISHEKKEK